MSDRIKENCKTCGRDDSYELFDDGDDNIALNKVKNDAGYEFYELVAMDGDHNFIKIWIPKLEFIDFSRAIRKVIQTEGLGEERGESEKEANEYLNRQTQRNLAEEQRQQQFCQPLSGFINKVEEWERRKKEAENG